MSAAEGAAADDVRRLDAEGLVVFAALVETLNEFNPDERGAASNGAVLVALAACAGSLLAALPTVDSRATALVDFMELLSRNMQRPPAAVTLVDPGAPPWPTTLQ